MCINVKDFTSGFRCFRRQVLESIGLEKMVSKGPSIVEEILYACHLKKYMIKEIPIAFEDRARGNSTKNMGESLIQPGKPFSLDLGCKYYGWK